MRLLALLIIALGFVGILEAVDLRSAGQRLWSVLVIVASAMAVVGGARLLERRRRP